MSKFPRLLVANVSDCSEPSVCTLAIMAALRNLGYHVQHFRSLAAFTPVDYVTPLTGLASRHLDPWIMSADLCRELFVHSAAHADVAVIEGSAPFQPRSAGAAGWPEIAQLLNCPVLGIVPSQPEGQFHARSLTEPVDALFIDQFTSRDQFNSLKGVLEGIYQKPVLGGLAAGEAATDCVEKMRCGRPLPGTALDELSRRIVEVTDLQKVLALASARPLPVRPPQLFTPRPVQRNMRVAVAYDDCFHCYFPDTLDALEYLGAELHEFSPLADERLPDGSDLVFLGCGRPELHAQALSENLCMRAALREHVCAGRRVYAEGGGAAYVCRQLKTGDTVVPMVGILSAEAELTGQPLPRPQPVELVCQRGTWMAEPGDRVRGYRSGVWRLRPCPDLTPAFVSDYDSPEILVRHHCVGSTVHLNFAAQPRVLQAFLAAHAPSLSI